MKPSILLLPLTMALAVPAVAKPLQTIAFGSCAKQYLPQPIWDSVLRTKPDLFIFLGDNIYGDTTDMGKLHSKYLQLGKIAGYQRLKDYCPVLATWDDHDYGKNDAGAEFTKKEESQQIFLDFFGEPDDSQRRKTPGIYDAKIFGEPGRRTQILLLDTRYFRGKLHRPGKPKLAIEGRTGPYLPNDDKSVPLLGEAQWDWLEAQLQKPAELRILCTSIQLISDQHGWECWANLPHERERLYALINKTKASGIITISGDRHHGEITKDSTTLPYPLYDVTASGMNIKSRFANEHNPKRLGSPYREEHFGTVLVDWETGTVTLQIRDSKSRPIIQARTNLQKLQFPTNR